jgi:AbrB family looped-hinge helix DNA binding protein
MADMGPAEDCIGSILTDLVPSGKFVLDVFTIWGIGTRDDRPVNPGWILNAHRPFLPPQVRKQAPTRLTSNGQVTIPQGVRERAGLMPGTDVAFEIGDGGVRLVKARGSRRTRGRKRIEPLRGHGDFKMTTDEILARMRGPAPDEG